MRRGPYLAKFATIDEAGNPSSKETSHTAIVWAANREQAEGVLEEGVRDRGWLLKEYNIKPLRMREGFVLLDE